jgi:antimicrobial peptide system SdpB family protein
VSGNSWHWNAAPEQFSVFASWPAIVATWALRLQVAAIYFHAGMAKLRVTEWADGTAMYYWLHQPTFGMNPTELRWLGPVLNAAPVPAMIGWGTIVLELALAASLMAKLRYRMVLLGLGFMLHFGILVFMGLTSFAVTMWGALLFLLWPLERPIPLPSLPSLPSLRKRPRDSEGQVETIVTREQEAA